MKIRQHIIAAIIADKTRALTVAVSLTLALVTTITTKLLGSELSSEHAGLVTLVATAVYGWIIEAYGAEQNARGAGEVQRQLQRIDPDIHIDRYIGPKTIETAEAIASSLILKAGAKPKKAPPTQQSPE